jgi:hypothetical protein
LTKSPTVFGIRGEEAGAVRKIRKQPIGTFRYQKRLSPEQAVTCKVQVFPFEVDLR